MPAEVIEGYCFKCRKKVAIESPEAVKMANGRNATRGQDAAGHTVWKIGRTLVEAVS